MKKYIFLDQIYEKQANVPTKSKQMSQSPDPFELKMILYEVVQKITPCAVNVIKKDVKVENWQYQRIDKSVV